MFRGGFLSLLLWDRLAKNFFVIGHMNLALPNNLLSFYKRSLAKARLVNSKKELKILTLDLGIGSLFKVQSLNNLSQQFLLRLPQIW
jgi:hypothetical protein